MKKHIFLSYNKTVTFIPNSMDACGSAFSNKYLHTDASNVYPKRKEMTSKSLGFQKSSAGLPTQGRGTRLL